MGSSPTLGDILASFSLSGEVNALLLNEHCMYTLHVVCCGLQEEVMLYSNVSGSVMLRTGLDFNKEKDNSETGLDYDSIICMKRKRKIRHVKTCC